MASLITLMIVLLLVVSIATAHNNDEGDENEIRLLENLEDLLIKDGNIEAYIKHKGAGHGPNCRSPDSLLHQFSSIKKSPAARRKLKKLLKKLNRKGSPLVKILPDDELIKMKSSIIDAVGRVDESCDASKRYRLFDGTCNNLANPEQGSAGTPLKRVVDNDYDDDLSSPRTKSPCNGPPSPCNAPLPNARDVSRLVFDANNKVIRHFTSLGIHLGQLIDHDLVAVENQEIECKPCEAENECFAITLEEEDPVFGGVQNCFPFVRSDHDSDSTGVRQQLNSITTWLDASFVYGSDENTANSLRDEDDPSLLKHLSDNVTKRDLLPPNKDLDACAGIDEEANIFCGLAGDGRVAEQPGLTSLHTLFLREHNRIARELHKLKQGMSVNEIYEIARKIVGAEWQHIVYNEYLPQITGEKLYNSKKLGATAPYEYDPDVDASIANVFAAAAFRFGHTMVPDKIVRAGKNYRTRGIKTIQMSEAFFNASFVFDESIPDGAVDSILRGMTVQKLNDVDVHLSSAITENLFGNPDKKGDGFDLASLNIQRGRDHGIPSYTEIRKEFCNFVPIENYKDLKGIMKSRNIRRLKKVYGKRGLKDIDAFVGLILEEHLPNALVGPTLACIFADQFNRLKFGDRFFYKNPQQFTKAQMEEIEKVTMARLMCDNVEKVKKIQPYVFMPQKKHRCYDSFYEYSQSEFWPHSKSSLISGLNNKRTACKSATNRIPQVDLSKFIDGRKAH